jgi:hypothetical protein
VCVEFVGKFGKYEYLFEDGMVDSRSSLRNNGGSLLNDRTFIVLMCDD